MVGFKNFCLSTVVILLAYLQYSCSTNERSSLLEHVPDSTNALYVFNIKNIILQSGGDMLSSGELRPNPSLMSFFDEDPVNSALFNFLCETAPFIDVENVFRYESNQDSGEIIMVSVKDTQPYLNYLKQISGNPVKDRGFNLFNFNEFYVVEKNNISWITRDYNYIINIEKKLGKNTFASFSPIREFIETEPHDIEMILKNDNSDYRFITGIMTFKKTGIYSQFSLMNEEGELFTLSDKIHEVQRELLKFIPSQTQVLFAIGTVENWQYIFDTFGSIFNKSYFYPYVFYYQIAKDYISKIDGTTMLALAPVAGRQALKNVSLDTWQILFLTHFPQDVTNEIIEMALNFFEMQGNRCTELSKGIYNVNLNHSQLMFGTQNGYIFISNYDIFDGGNTDLATAYEAKRVVAEVLIPYGSETMKAFDLPWGVDFNISLNATTAQIVLKLPGSNGVVLKDLVNFFSKSSISDFEVSIND